MQEKNYFLFYFVICASKTRKYVSFGCKKSIYYIIIRVLFTVTSFLTRSLNQHMWRIRTVATKQTNPVNGTDCLSNTSTYKSLTNLCWVLTKDRFFRSCVNFLILCNTLWTIPYSWSFEITLSITSLDKAYNTSLAIVFFLLAIFSWAWFTKRIRKSTFYNASFLQ